MHVADSTTTCQAQARAVLDLLNTFLPKLSPPTALDTLRQDVRFGARSLTRSPLASGLAVISLALGMGATSDEAIVGESVVLDGTPHGVVGILPPGPGIPGLQADIWVPLRVSGQERRSGHNSHGVVLLAE